jgi:hypothetical protein
VNPCAIYSIIWNKHLKNATVTAALSQPAASIKWSRARRSSAVGSFHRIQPDLGLITAGGQNAQQKTTLNPEPPYDDTASRKLTTIIFNRSDLNSGDTTAR